MNILEINTAENKGGAAKIAYFLKSDLKLQGHNTSMFVKIKYSKDSDVFVIKNKNIISCIIKKITGKSIDNYVSTKFHRIIASDIDFFASDNILKTREFKEAEVIHCHNLHGNYFKLDTLHKMSLDKPVVWTFHDMWPITPHCAHAYECPVQDGFFSCKSKDDYQGLLWHNEKYLRNKKRNIYDKTNFTIVVPSLWLKDKIAQTSLKNKSITLIYNGIDESKFKKYDKQSAREELGLPIDKKILLFISIGKNTMVKGWEFMQKAVSFYKNDPDILFVCIGSKKFEEYENNNIIKYVNYINDETTMAKYYSAADIFLFPSLAENFPLTVLEAMSCGLPVVSFDVGGTKEALIHKKNGYIAKYLDGDDLINGVEYILNLSSDRLEDMSKGSIERVKNNFTKNLMIKKYKELFEIKIKEYKKYDKTHL